MKIKVDFCVRFFYVSRQSDLLGDIVIIFIIEEFRVLYTYSMMHKLYSDTMKIKPKDWCID